MSGVIATIVTRDDICTACQVIYNATFSLVTPLGSNDDGHRHKTPPLLKNVHITSGVKSNILPVYRIRQWRSGKSVGRQCASPFPLRFAVSFDGEDAAAVISANP